MRIYKSFFRFEKCRKACKYRLYRLMRTYKEIVKNYILISYNFISFFLFVNPFSTFLCIFFTYLCFTSTIICTLCTSRKDKPVQKLSIIHSNITLRLFSIATKNPYKAHKYKLCRDLSIYSNSASCCFVLNYFV